MFFIIEWFCKLIYGKEAWEKAKRRNASNRRPNRRNPRRKP